MKSKNVFLVLCGAAGVVHCGGRLEVGETGMNPPMDTSPASGGTSNGVAGKSGYQAGRGGSSGTGTASHAGTGNPDLGNAGERGMNQGGGGSGPGITAGAGDEAGQNAGQGGTSGGGSGGGAGAPPTPCDCGSTTALTAVDCQDGATYSAFASNDGKVVLYTATTYPYPESSQTSTESGLWTSESGTVYTVHRYPLALSADGQKALFNTMSGLTVLRTLGGKDVVLPLSGYQLSANGLTVAGRDDASGAAATWTAAGGIVTPDLGAPAGAPSAIRALSADASVLAGSFDGAVTQPFVWNDTGTHVLGNDSPSDASGKGYVFSLSSDGSTATGILTTGEPTNDPSPLYALFRWTETEGITTLGPCRIADPHGACVDYPYSSANGSVVAATVAIDTYSSFTKAFRWTHDDGLVDIDPDDYAYVRGVSTDGVVIAGSVTDIDTGNPSTPFLWTSTLGKQNLADRLASAGADLNGWTLGDVSALSSDGTVVVGSGTCHGVPALYRAYLPR